MQTQSTLIGEFTYLDASTASSLHRNGKVYTRRDSNGSDNKWVGANFDRRSLTVHNAREYSGSRCHKLSQNGFELLHNDIEHLHVDFMHNLSILSNYYPHCEDVVKEASGARFVAAFDHNVRSVSGSRNKQHIEGGQQVQPPLHMVHGDYTLTSAAGRLRALAKQPADNDTYKPLLTKGETLLDQDAVEHAISEGRFAIINVWRSIARDPVATHPLALCDAALVDPDDLVVFEIHYADRIGENYYSKYADAHKWFYYPLMTREEALLIKQWDSEGELAQSGGVRPDSASPASLSTFSFHSAFEDPTVAQGAPDRWSIEVRCAVIY